MLSGELRGISDGPAGTNKTLRLMRDIVRQWRRAPLVIDLARRLTVGLPQKDYPGEVRALFCYVRDRIRYVRDPNGVEALATPEATLNSGAGDCDDKVILLASLLEAIGHPTRMVAMKESPVGPYAHVFLETKLGSRWYALESTEPWEPGRAAWPQYARMVMYN